MLRYQATALVVFGAFLESHGPPGGGLAEAADRYRQALKQKATILMVATIGQSQFICVVICNNDNNNDDNNDNTLNIYTTTQALASPGLAACEDVAHLRLGSALIRLLRKE